MNDVWKLFLLIGAACVFLCTSAMEEDPSAKYQLLTGEISNEFFKSQNAIQKVGAQILLDFQKQFSGMLNEDDS